MAIWATVVVVEGAAFVVVVADAGVGCPSPPLRKGIKGAKEGGGKGHH